MHNLKEVLKNLDSDKIKERQQALLLIRDIFSQDRAIERYCVKEDGSADHRTWLIIFQSLYRVVLAEKKACMKVTTKSTGPTAAAQKRFSDAASMVRWLVEKSAHLLQTKVVDSLLSHLLNTMINGDELLSPISLDYIKALKCLISYAPHMDHINDEDWVKLVQVSLNVIIGDPITEDWEIDVPNREEDSEHDSEMYVDEAEGTPNIRKRRRNEAGSSSPLKVNARSAVKPKRAPRTRVSLEQVEFASLLSFLLSSRSTPLLSSSYPWLASALLSRLTRFLELYPSDSSLLHDYITTLSSTLKHLSLNKRKEVEVFARESWDGLVALWSTKDKRMKEGLTVVLRALFPYFTADIPLVPSTHIYNYSEGLRKLWDALDGEVQSRWGVEGMSLDSLRLELPEIGNEQDHNLLREPFVANTFRAGWSFDSSQALSWAILELQAGCAGKLFQLSESMHSTSGRSKRKKSGNPVNELLSTISSQSTPLSISFHLQVLIFIVDQHWPILHESLRQQIIQTLLQLLSSDENTIQSWVFLNFAAIAYGEQLRASSDALESHPHDTQVWDHIWAHAIRRASAPAVSRSACHAANTLLVCSRALSESAQALLSSQRILLEIEAFVKEMDVQGPPFPFDSVCMFLAQCLKISSQDVRLYRMQVEEKILTWLIDAWKIAGTDRRKMTLHLVKDPLQLLECICGLSKRSDLVCRIPVPNSHVADFIIEETRMAVIRDYVIFARLPPFRNRHKTATALNSAEAASSGDPKAPELPLDEPRGRERKISSFLLKSLDALLTEWDDYTSVGLPTAEMARRSMDFAVIGLSFESLLVANGTTANRRVLQSAAKLLSIVTPLLKDERWTQMEKASVSIGLEPLVFSGVSPEDERKWETLLPPNVRSGISTEVLKGLLGGVLLYTAQRKSLRIHFLRILWQNADVQTCLAPVMKSVRDVLHIALGEALIDSNSSQVMDVDDKDDFGTTRNVASLQSNEVNNRREFDHSTHLLLDVCLGFLAVGPFLQSASGEPTRDKELSELVLRCCSVEPEKFLILCPIFLEKIQQKTLNLTATHLDRLFEGIGTLLGQYRNSKNERWQLLVIKLLDSTLSMWSTPHTISSEVARKARRLCGWLSKIRDVRYWAVRDSLVQFLDRYLSNDPTEISWTSPNEGEKENDRVNRLEYKPSKLLPGMNSDDDIRVRFRAAVANARLFLITDGIGTTPSHLYPIMKLSYTTDLDSYEHMLTRILSLGNIMIVSSEVRRGPYFHLLEGCLDKYGTTYTRHTDAILNGVSQRLGLASLAALSDAYASQIAFSLVQGGFDFLQLPPSLLGFRDRKHCAQATFRAAAPTYLLGGGRQSFEAHCKAIQKPTLDGLRECFGEVVGYQVVGWFESLGEIVDVSEGELDSLLRQKTFDGDIFEESLQQSIDGIVVSILRTLRDHDITDNGPIASALRSLGQNLSAIETFRELTSHRRLDTFLLHDPNVPVFGVWSVLRSLNWLASKWPASSTKATTYHVLHQLLANLHRSPFINEKIRLINAMSLWISLHAPHFEDETLLYTLMHGASSFLAHSDLARSAQSLLEWGFGCYRKKRLKDTRLTNILIRICCVAHDYESNAHDLTLARMGADLCEWIDREVILLSHVSSAMKEKVVEKALPAWRHQPSPQMAELFENMSAAKVSSALGDHRVTSDKFRVVRRLRECKDSDETRFATKDFWRLKECLSTKDRLQDEDLEAFSSLLVSYHGRIANFDGDQSERHRRNIADKVPIAGENASIRSRNSIVAGLYAILQDDTVSHVNIAYNTLRLVTSAIPSGLLQAAALPAELKRELSLLEEYPRALEKRPAHEIAELVTSEPYMDSTKNFSSWIAMLTGFLSDILSTSDPIFAQLNSILHSNVAFAEEMLPVFVHVLLQAENSEQNKEVLSQYFTKVLCTRAAATECLRCIVELVLHLRYFPRQPDKLLSYNEWLDIDFILLAKSAITCGAYTTALLFLELAPDCKNSPNLDASEQVLYEIYAHINEPDGFYGINTEDLHNFLIKRLHHEKQWAKAFRFHGAALEAGNIDKDEGNGLLKSFHSFGFDRLAINILQSGGKDLDSSSAISYDLGWRTETWDLPNLEQNSPGASLYHALRAVYHGRDPRAISTVIRQSLSQETSRLNALGSESITQIREVAQDFMCLSQISQWTTNDVQSRLNLREIDISQWNDFINIDPHFEFSDLESIMATRISLVRSVRHKEKRKQIGNLVTDFGRGLLNIEKKCLLRLSECARKANEVQIALNSVVRAQHLEQHPSFEVTQEFAQVLWLQKEEKLAIQFLQRLINRKQDVNERSDFTQEAILLVRLGTWISEACLEKPADISQKYFNPAIDILEKLNDDHQDLSSHSLVYRQCAIFAERQYHSILKSPDAIRIKVYVDRKKQEIQQRSAEMYKVPEGSGRHKVVKSEKEKAEKVLLEDAEMFRKYNTARDAYLRQALDMYSRSLQVLSADDDDGAVRFCSLWLANFDDDLVLKDILPSAVARIPSGKLVFLAHQLTARMAKSTGHTLQNQGCLQQLIIRMCREHPFHSLYQVFCLQPTDKYLASSNRRQSGRTSTQTERSTAAMDVFDRLRDDPTSGQRVRDVERLCTAYLEWAKYPIKGDSNYKNKTGTGFDIPPTVKILKIKNLKVPVTTYHTPLDPTLKYDNCVWIQEYRSKFDTAGGVNLPKITVCMGANNVAYKQLFKGEGNDDMRQDAVMEQVFDIVNHVLRRDRETRRRELRVRDYKVIPLDSQSGLLEFVGNTTPLRAWLDKAHSKYQPNDFKASYVGERLKEVQYKGAEIQVPKFKELRKRFHPVMRHYFTEKHKSPMRWFTMRLNYTRSVATTSIVGHVLGLGDRHTSNILLDNGSGEVVHIDLGIAFDQGKFLNVPERVPFRMTADMVDGMGIAGTQGVFQRCAEETLRVLREDSELIMTILEVFKHDPLHSWTANEFKVKQAQQGAPPALPGTNLFALGMGIDMSSGSAEEAADRALGSVARKLDKSLSVECAVNELITEATSITNLATIWYGWGPHL